MAYDDVAASDPEATDTGTSNGDVLEENEAHGDGQDWESRGELSHDIDSSFLTGRDDEGIDGYVGRSHGDGAGCAGDLAGDGDDDLEVNLEVDDGGIGDGG